MEQNKCDLSHGEVEIPIIETCSSMQCFEPQKWSCYLFQFTVPLWRHNQDGHQNQSSRQHSRIHPQQSDFIVGGILLNYAEVKNILLLKSCITEYGASSVPSFHHDILLQFRKHNDLQCMNLPHCTVCTSSQNQQKLSISDPNTQDTHQITLPTCPVDHTQYLCQTPSYQIVKLSSFLFSHCSFVSVVSCMCMYMYSWFLFGFFPHERFFPLLGFTLHGVFPWSV